MVKRFPLELLKKWLKEAEEYKKKGDIQHACEKLYSVVESVIKILTEKENVEAFKEFQQKKRWTTELLSKAVSQLKSKYKELRALWTAAYMLHVFGFHENTILYDDFETNSEIIFENIPEILRKAGFEFEYKEFT